jgi:hypothetical protein
VAFLTPSDSDFKMVLIDQAIYRRGIGKGHLKTEKRLKGATWKSNYLAMRQLLKQLKGSQN